MSMAGKPKSREHHQRRADDQHCARSINGGGVAVVDGWIYAGSGYGLGGLGMPGNVLLAFGPPVEDE